MKFFDDKSKEELHWYKRNYFYIGTLLFILLNIILFACSFVPSRTINRVWSEFDLTNLFVSFLNIFGHKSWEHVLHNSLMLAVGGLYVERKTGTFSFLLLILGFSFIGGGMLSACANSFAWRGSSVVWFALWGYILVDYIFSFQKHKRNKTNIILGVIILFIEYIRSGFYDKVGGGIGWSLIPHQLVYNAGHYVGLIVGIIFALIVCLSQFKHSKNN